MSDEVAYANTNRELWRERDDYYADSIHLTEHGEIGINCAGHVFVRTLREWHRLAAGSMFTWTFENPSDLQAALQADTRATQAEDEIKRLRQALQEILIEDHARLGDRREPARIARAALRDAL